MRNQFVLQAIRQRNLIGEALSGKERGESLAAGYTVKKGIII